MLIRRSIFVFLLLILRWISSKLLIEILSGAQLINIIYIIYARPFKDIKCNIIEIVNEFYFSFLLSALIYLNIEDKWASMYTQIYSWILTSNNFTVLFIILCKPQNPEPSFTYWNNQNQLKILIQYKNCI